jgi:hypothetical protein
MLLRVQIGRSENGMQLLRGVELHDALVYASVWGGAATVKAPLSLPVPAARHP